MYFPQKCTYPNGAKKVIFVTTRVEQTDSTNSTTLLLLEFQEKLGSPRNNAAKPAKINDVRISVRVRTQS